MRGHSVAGFKGNNSEERMGDKSIRLIPVLDWLPYRRCAQSQLTLQITK